MTRVKRDNVILDIKDSEVQRYLDLGYDVIGENGKVEIHCIPTDLGTLQKEFVNHCKEIKELKDENEKLKGIITDLQLVNKKPVEDQPVEDEPVEDQPVKPKRKKKSDTE